jgi:hypothetical protein
VVVGGDIRVGDWIGFVICLRFSLTARFVKVGLGGLTGIIAPAAGASDDSAGVGVGGEAVVTRSVRDKVKELVEFEVGVKEIGVGEYDVSEGG